MRTNDDVLIFEKYKASFTKKNTKEDPKKDSKNGKKGDSKKKDSKKKGKKTKWIPPWVKDKKIVKEDIDPAAPGVSNPSPIEQPDDDDDFMADIENRQAGEEAEEAGRIGKIDPEMINTIKQKFIAKLEELAGLEEWDPSFLAKVTAEVEKAQTADDLIEAEYMWLNKDEEVVPPEFFGDTEEDALPSAI